MDFSFYNQLLLIFACSVMAIAVLNKLRMPPILGYLAVGIILGPAVSDSIADYQTIALLAEIGVVFLLFSIGLEFSFAQLTAMRRMVLGLGGAQVLSVTAVIFLVGWLLQLPVSIALLAAAGMALSSTAIVSKELTEHNELRTEHGQTTIAILIFQDIAAVLFLTLIPALGNDSYQALGHAVLLALGKSIGLFVAMLLIGKFLLPKLFHEVATVRSQELFLLTVLVIALFAGWITHFLSLSMALGGFLAGMMLGESHYRHQIEHDIRPFRDVLLGLFFVSVGAMLNLHLFVQNWFIILIATASLLLVKSVLITLLAQLFGQKRETALTTGLYLSQSGEFCLALIALAGKQQLVDQETQSILLAVSILSMVTTPFLIRYSSLIIKWLFPQSPITPADTHEQEIAQLAHKLNQHTIICGYGRVGQSIGRFLKQQQLPYTALDDDPIRIKEASIAESHIYFGDCRRTELLKAIGVGKARLAIVCIDDPTQAITITKNIRSLRHDIPIIVRTRDDTYLDALKSAGATEVIPEVMESSLMIISHVLVMLDQPAIQVRKQIDQVRKDRYQLLHGYYQGEKSTLVDPKGKPRQILHAITLREDAACINLPVSELLQVSPTVEIQDIKRNDQSIADQLDTPIQQGDCILVSGLAEEIEQVETLLLSG
ncbi:cation:proton antiporter [Endozoicomonas sp. SM1973]|uniref:Cation:proton antiporter n=1 Tax=Spartinivicinus marinus TaxID=2994442 RepID=A0A853I332_9GAMM|nr:monovalent cation:proton antiporter family protein [Spartinivicinus marinus]MCX4029190.1 cation:proton antiporter [Spartinivicinus marinus]NYZ65902.1 cation:proton antiporter [Spartinivicinus marinus]